MKPRRIMYDWDIKVRTYSYTQPHVENRSSKDQALSELKQSIILSLPEEKLWFAVLRRAILDIGMRHATRHAWYGETPLIIKKHNVNSDAFFQDIPTFEYVCERIGTYRSYVLRMLKKYRVLPVPNGYYDESKYKRKEV